jgi:hypothetical protein
MSVSDAYIVKRAPDALLRRLPPRRGPQYVLAGLTDAQTAELIDGTFSQWGFDNFVGCQTGEINRRPVPHVVERKGTQNLEALYEAWAGDLFTWVFRRLAAPVQTYDKRSRMGFPYFEVRPDKLEVLLPHFREFRHGDYSAIEGGYTINNIRLQPESRKKKRNYMFINRDGELYEDTVEGDSRKLKNGRIGSRTRLVFNQPITNLCKQIVDTAIHNVFLEYPAFHHDMTSRVRETLPGKVVALDIKHFDRSVGATVPIRARVIGGRYQEMEELVMSMPYLSIADNWKKCFFLHPNREAGFIEQLGSGDSAVAPIAKEIMMIIFASWVARRKQVERTRAFELAASGGEPGGARWLNYGDDNVVYGHEREVDDLIAYISEYLPVEMEDPPKFLGYVYFTDEERRGFMLSLTSYLLNQQLPERSPYSTFRPFPMFGTTERRDVYRVQGEPIIGEKVIPWEEDFWKRFGYPPELVADIAEEERKSAYAASLMATTEQILGKDYLLSDLDKSEMTGTYSVLARTVTDGILRDLVGKEWLKLL